MDITNLFKATIRTVKSRQKAQGITFKADTILSRSRQKSEFFIKTKTLIENIRKLHDYLMEYRDAYINVSRFLLSEGPSMTDGERDKIDADASSVIKTCSETIRLFQKDAKKEKCLEQQKVHREAVLSILQNYLKCVCKIYSEQKAIRVKKVVDRKRLSRLAERKTGHQSGAKKLKLENVSNGVTVAHTKKDDKDTKFSKETEEDFSPEEIEMFEQENKQLLLNVNSMDDEVKSIEGKVVEISRLQEIFTEKVLEQDADINRIADTVVGTTANVEEGNENIREAMKSNAGFRVWILFFLVVLSTSLLFLDWYNP